MHFPNKWFSDTAAPRQINKTVTQEYISDYRKAIC